MAAYVIVGILVLGGVLLWRNAAPGGELLVDVTESPTATPSPAPVLPVVPGDWQPMAAGPLSPRRDTVTAWTGTELLVWGGRMRDRLGAFGDGAAYEPVGDRWRPLPPAPLQPRGSAAAVWTGTELILWGGVGDRGEGADVTDLPFGTPFADGAAYDPSTDRWRTLAESPLSARRDAEAAWVDGRMVVWGGVEYQGASQLTDGALYDPAADTWTLLPAGPLAGRADSDSEIAVVGDSVLILTSSFQGLAVAVFDVAGGAWVEGVAAPPLRGDVPIALAHLSDGALLWGEAAAPDTGGAAVMYDPRERAWRDADQPPRAPARREDLASAGNRAIAWSEGRGLVFDAAANRWATMSAAPDIQRGTTVQAWLDDRLVIWNSATSAEDSTRAATWVPAETW